MPAPTHTNQTVRVTKTISFVSTDKHRIRGNPEASLWSIDYKNEYLAFLRSKPHRSNGITWGVQIDGQQLAALGYNIRTKNLKFAKFTSHENNNNLWHGYPADYIVKIQDRPSGVFLRLLVLKGYLTKAKSRKIEHGQEI